MDGCASGGAGLSRGEAEEESHAWVGDRLRRGKGDPTDRGGAGGRRRKRTERGDEVFVSSRVVFFFFLFIYYYI